MQQFIEWSGVEWSEVKGMPMTPLRRQVLQTLLDTTVALSSQDLVEQLSKSSGTKVIANSVYRVLAFLEDHGFVHKLKTHHKYFACQEFHSCCKHTEQLFLVCSKCFSVQEHKLSGELGGAIKAQYENYKFKPSDKRIEMDGVCGNCA